MITEQQIESIIEEISKEKEEAILAFVEGESNFSSYLLGEQFKLLSEEEKEVLLFVHIVVWNCYNKHIEHFDFDVDDYMEAEETNWTLLDKLKLKREEKLDVMFKDYDQEDLLAFVEDMVDQEELSDLGKELVFVTAKSYIDYRFKQ